MRDAAHLLDDCYPAVLTGKERALREALLQFDRGLPAEARETPALAQVERLLAGLGLRGGDRGAG